MCRIRHRAKFARCRFLGSPFSLFLLPLGGLGFPSSSTRHESTLSWLFALLLASIRTGGALDCFGRLLRWPGVRRQHQGGLDPHWPAGESTLDFPNFVTEGVGIGIEPINILRQCLAQHWPRGSNACLQLCGFESWVLFESWVCCEKFQTHTSTLW